MLNSVPPVQAGLVSKGSFGKPFACMVGQWVVEGLQGILHVWRKASRSQKEPVLVPCESHHCNTSEDGSVEVKVILMQTSTQIYTGIIELVSQRNQAIVY